MALTDIERIARAEIEGLATRFRNEGLSIEADHDEIRRHALEEFTRQLDGKIANLQPGEGLSITWRMDIIRTNGKVRGGSGAERNMPEYIEWREAVYERDDYTCQECGATGRICAHHIKPWAHYPDLRFDVDNGITLCRPCHADKHPHLNF